VDLPGLDEPVGLRARAATDPDAVRAEIGSGRLIAAPLWKAWSPALATKGVDRPTLVAILRGYGYELWLWAAGERTWAQCLEGLAGRVDRRAAATRAAKPRQATRAAKPRQATKAAKPRQATRAAKPRQATKARGATGAGKGAKAAKTRGATKAQKAKATKGVKVTRSRAATRAGKVPAASAARKTRRG
jgi:hypothetical protein